MNIFTIIDTANKQLKLHSQTSRIDAELLLCKILNVTRSFLYAHPEKEITKSQQKKFDKLLEKRLNGAPIAYLLGTKEFWSLKFVVNKNVLIPRPETELLVELSLKLATNTNAKIADLGTGSGAIALSIAHERPNWKIFATDKSKKALKTAILNAQLLNIKNIEFHHGSWFKALPKFKFDAITSNPPYIEENDAHLTRGDVRFEPKSALVAGKSGMKDLNEIIKNAPKFLTKNGILLLEHGFNQATKVAAILRDNNFAHIQTFQDLAGNDRVTIGYFF